MKQVSLVTIFLIVVSLHAGAQGFYNNGSILSLSSQAVVIVPDSLVNKGTIKNDGDLRITGAWINQGTYDATALGKINFNSDLPQTINHNDQSFKKLTISGTGEKQFLANITIESELDLQNSNLKSVNGAKIIFAPGAVVTGGSNQSHIVGPVEVKGAGTWLFPVGNGTTYLPVEVLGITDATAAGTIVLNELSGQTLTGTPELVKLSTKRYWELNLNSGGINSSKIKLPLSNEEGLTANLELLVVAASSTATSNYISIGQSSRLGDLSSGSVTSEGTTILKYYTVAAISGEPDIEVFNGISPSIEGKNDFLKIKNIESYFDNEVTIFNRWGDRVFTITGYDNDTKVFRGESNNGNKLPAGTYFYSIMLKVGLPIKNGYLEIR
ncbi:MAG: gliding motility-associated C-terminal domain-containing protein [Cyclobacteriaceae bacterium]|nr:gliding motility-associated C-terminal domain-containing protein [Cyclobacteriaceae bacterium]